MYVDHLKQLHNDIQAYFSDLLQLTVPHWFVDQLVADASDVDITQQENDTTAQERFKRQGSQKLWMSEVMRKN